MSTLRKSYLGAPPPANWGSQGFNVSTNVQRSQARIPQFFNFIGSGTDDVQVANKTFVNVFTSSPQILNFVLEEHLEARCEAGYYIYPFDGAKKMTTNNPLALEIQRKEVQKALEQEESSTVSTEEPARVRAEVRAVMAQKFAIGRRQLGCNPVV